MRARKTKVINKLYHRIHTDAAKESVYYPFGKIGTSERAILASGILVDEALSIDAPYRKIGIVWLEAVDAIHGSLESGDLRLLHILSEPIAFFAGIISSSLDPSTKRAIPLIQEQLRYSFKCMVECQATGKAQLELLSECVFLFLVQLISFPKTEKLASEVLSELAPTKRANLRLNCIRCLLGLRFYRDKTVIRNLERSKDTAIASTIHARIAELWDKDLYIETIIEPQKGCDEGFQELLANCSDQLP